MEYSFYSSYLAAWFAILALFLVSRYLRRPKLNLPPGPRPWPIIGNLNLMGPLPHRSIHDVTLKYGPLTQLRFGSCPVIVASSFEMAKIILQTMDLNFVDRPKLAAGKYTTYNYCNITWAPYGPHWHQAHKMYLLELFGPKRLESSEYIRVEEMDSLIKGLYASRGKVITLKEHLSKLSLNVICRMVLGKRYLDESEKSFVSLQEFRKMLDELIQLNGVLNIGDSIPWINSLDLQGYIKRMKAVGKKFDRFFEQVLDEHNQRRRSVKNYVANDLVDVLLQLADNPDLEVKIERCNVKAFTQDLLAGGTESSAMLVEWSISELLKKPEIFEKATEELDRVIGQKRWVREEDIPNLPYIDAIWKEVMRLHPVAPLLTPRLAREDCKIGEYDVAKGTRVVVSTWSIGRDPEIWDNPNEFMPDRFINRDIDVKGRHFELLPFGSGRRMCPGYNMGLRVSKTSLANVLHGFTWKLPDTMKKEDLDMFEIWGLLTPKKTPLMTVVEPRLPHNLYLSM